MQQVDKNRNSNNEKIIIEIEANFKCTKLSVFVKRNSFNFNYYFNNIIFLHWTYSSI